MAPKPASLPVENCFINSSFRANRDPREKGCSGATGFSIVDAPIAAAGLTLTRRGHGHRIPVHHRRIPVRVSWFSIRFEGNRPEVVRVRSSFFLRFGAGGPGGFEIWENFDATCGRDVLQRSEDFLAGLGIPLTFIQRYDQRTGPFLPQEEPVLEPVAEPGGERPIAMQGEE